MMYIIAMMMSMIAMMMIVMKMIVIIEMIAMMISGLGRQGVFIPLYTATLSAFD